MKNISVYSLFKYAAITGNVIYILWVLRDGIPDSRFASFTVYWGLILLLILNIILLFLKEKTN